MQGKGCFLLFHISCPLIGDLMTPLLGVTWLQAVTSALFLHLKSRKKTGKRDNLGRRYGVEEKEKIMVLHSTPSIRIAFLPLTHIYIFPMLLQSS